MQMCQRYLVTVIIGLCVVWQSLAGAVEVAPRITDREIIEGLADLRGDLKRIELGQNNIQKQVDDVRKDLKDFMLWGFGITFAGMFTLVGFVLWDRRSALSPAVTRLRQLEEHGARVERALQEMAQRDPNVAEALRHVGLL
jgi:hypothetical protein